MGSFGGHLLPGLLFITVSVWWTISVFVRRYSKHNGQPFMSTSTYPCLCLYGRLKHWPVEACIKVLLGTLGIVLETIKGIDDKGKFTGMNNAQHVTMYSCVVISGIVDLLMYFKVSLLPSTDYATLVLSFTVEALLFQFHIVGRSKFDVLVHTLLIYAVYGCVISVIVESVYRDLVLSPLFRCYFTLLQGTWFVQLAFLLYSPFPGAVPWKDDDYGELNLVSMIFSWHAVIDFVVIFVVGPIVFQIVSRCRGVRVDMDSDVQEEYFLLQEGGEEFETTDFKLEEEELTD